MFAMLPIRPDSHGVSADLQEFGRLDILVNNAGILDDALLGMVSDDMIEHSFRINTFGAIHHLQAASRLMQRGRGGSIVNLTSIVGVVGNEGQTVYSATKSALIGLTKSAAKELAPHKVRVNAVAPGFIDTDMTRALPAEKFDKGCVASRWDGLGHPATLLLPCSSLRPKCRRT